MGSHPINLTFRFLLELGALFSIGFWGWNLGDGWLRYLLVILGPVVAGIIWGVFAVPSDPSRSGKAPVPIPGILRLLLELGIFGAAGFGLYQTGYHQLGLGFGIVVILHYLVSYDRISWLIEQ